MVETSIIDLAKTTMEQYNCLVMSYLTIVLIIKIPVKVFVNSSLVNIKTVKMILTKVCLSIYLSF